jgi:two-component system cell cycle response regulator
MGNKKILIVDDDPDIRQGLHLRLQANQYDTFFARDALSAMVEARKNKPDLVILDLGLPASEAYIATERRKSIAMIEARKRQPDLIVLDVGASAGDGFEVLAGLKSTPSLAAIPVVVLSARDLRANRERALQAGAIAYLQKPVEDAELLAVVRKALSEPAQSKTPPLSHGGRLPGKPAAEIHEPGGQIKEGEQGNKKILIVDDDPDIRQGLHVRLKANHYDTFFAADAFAAMTEARKQQPDLIILDLGLPAGDGFVVMERLSSVPALAVIPIIVVSGRDARANHERALKAGAKAFLQKPVDDRDLLAVIRKALGESAQAEMHHHASI